MTARRFSIHWLCLILMTPTAMAAENDFQPNLSRAYGWLTPNNKDDRPKFTVHINTPRGVWVLSSSIGPGEYLILGTPDCTGALTWHPFITQDTKSDAGAFRKELKAEDGAVAAGYPRKTNRSSDTELEFDVTLKRVRLEDGTRIGTFPTIKVTADYLPKPPSPDRFQVVTARAQPSDNRRLSVDAFAKGGHWQIFSSSP